MGTTTGFDFTNKFEIVGTHTFKKLFLIFLRRIYVNLELFY
ncbi:hypothetical protein G436_2930 [Leptospira interrogans serovar Hardjo str. Norma]|uniref:Uncharacterized protein n=1 Tax=Leptospira interrogans serovar Hardjo str. Norma TaxID=1279460 RepID=A0A0M3TM23_LEPIR|nr:hypothetical protein G436_2930 [Leptospira interrogans serovar Hardjo str. Norma]